MLACMHARAQLVAAASAADASGLPLLHRAVRSGRPAMPAALMRWAGRWGARLNVAAAAPGPAGGGLTPLHLAAVLGDGGAMAHALLAGSMDACHAWTGARAADGSTPAQLAAAEGRGALSAYAELRVAAAGGEQQQRQRQQEEGSGVGEGAERGGAQA
jgi:hypothetical protein